MMKELLSLFLIIFLLGCSSQKSIIQGYQGEKLSRVVERIRGTTPKETLKKLGTPALYGRCKTCGQKILYRIIYLNKDMRRFYVDLSYNTDMEIDCVIMDFLPNPKTNKFVFSNYSIHKNCNQRDGELMKFKEILDSN